MEEKGIKETKEALVGVNELALALIYVLKDGFQLVGDVTALFKKLSSDEEVKTKLVEAVKGISSVPAEVKDLSLNEGVELAGLQLSYLPKMIEAFKAEESKSA